MMFFPVYPKGELRGVRREGGGIASSSSRRPGQGSFVLVSVDVHVLRVPASSHAQEVLLHRRRRPVGQPLRLRLRHGVDHTPETVHGHAGEDTLDVLCLLWSLVCSLHVVVVMTKLSMFVFSCCRDEGGFACCCCDYDNVDVRCQLLSRVMMLFMHVVVVMTKLLMFVVSCYRDEGGFAFRCCHYDTVEVRC